MERPTFAIACPDFHPQTCGVGDHSMRLGAELQRRGYPVEIFTRSPGQAHPEAPGLPVTGVEGRSPLVVAERIRHAVLRQQPSHLILQYTPQMWGAGRLGSPATTWLAGMARRAGIDVTVIAHELYTELHPRPDLLVSAALHRAQIMMLARAANRLFVTTGTRADQLRPFWRAAGAHGEPGVIRIGPNALPVPRVPVPGRARLGIFSTLAANKRFDVVLGAFERVWRQRPHSELVLIGDVAGRGDRRAAGVHDAVARHPARQSISFTGKLALPQVARAMADLDVFLFPMTTGANTRSGTLPVALGSGLPVVALDGSETDHPLFADEVNVLFAGAMTAEAFAARALRILDQPELAQRLSDGARRLYETHLAWPVIVDAFLEGIDIVRAR